ncbi:MAG: PLP-dependent aminotransferase family protein [Acidobacteriota bacterium]|nr:PLP-dependent aminotransferase family protein [Acidobacteriota bacterium]
MPAISDLDPTAEAPLYRQLYEKIRAQIETGAFVDGERLPPTRELAGSLGLNRTTVSAAYDLLETEGLLKGHVGRGSFVNAPRHRTGVAWENVLDVGPTLKHSGAAIPARISFANSRPSELLFPLEEFRATCREVIESDEATAILQLGSPAGYSPLRRYLLEKARLEGTARASDDILITSGCQQAFDLLQRILIANGETVLLEDPVYAGVRNAFQRGGARLVGIPVGPDGIELDLLERAISRERPRLLVITSNFQNPTGATLPLAKRQALLRITARAGVVVVENDIYGDLRYEGEHIQPVKQLDASGDTVLLRSFSKLAFPGLRVGWVIGPRALIEKLTEAKQWSDLHTDQLSQAVFLRFAESGRLAAHRTRMLEAGRDRLQTALRACQTYLPESATFSRPRGGMNLWVRLPAPLDTGELLLRCEREGVTYLPGRFFGVGNIQSGSLRISFAGLAPDRIEAGIAVLGNIFRSELERVQDHAQFDSVPAMV